MFTHSAGSWTAASSALSGALFALLTVFFALCGATASHAVEIGIDDNLSPAKYQALTSGNVDPKTGEFLLQSLDLSVGSGAFPSRLDLVRVQSSLRGMEYTLEGRAVCTTCGGYVFGDGQYPLNLRTDLWGGVNIVLFGATYSFVQDGSGGYENLKRDGAVLFRDSDNKRLEFRSKNGLKAFFEFAPSYTCGFSAPSDASGGTSHSKSVCQRVRYVEMPDGESISYRYVARTDPYWTSFTLAYLSEVRNSRGYGIQFTYGSSISETLVTQATAFRASCANSATVNCSAGTLGSVSYQHDSVSLGLRGPYSYRLKYFTDANGKRTEYEYEPQSIRPIAAKYPANPTVRAFTNGYGSDGKLISQRDALSNETVYSYGASETTLTDPLSHVTRYGFSGTSPLPAYIEDGNGDRTTYTYDTYLRLTKTTAPEGNATELTLDDRGNVTTSRSKPKAGSGLADLVSTASYPPCDATNYRICNQPLYTIDARGARSDFAYDAAHGGLTVAIAPPDAEGLRAVTRVGYASFAPAADTAPPPLSGAANIPEASIFLPVTLDRCLSSVPDVTPSFACPAADTVRTSQSYLPSTTASRSSYELQSITLDPSGLNLTSSFAYDQVGNVVSGDGPRSDADLTAYVYDSNRRLVLRTDPTAGGASPRTQYVFNDDGRLIRTEASIGSGWASASIAYDTRGLPIQQIGPDGSPVTQSYDIAGRPEEIAQTVDGLVRRTRNILDAGGRVTAVQLAADTPLEQAVATVTYSPNGRMLTRADASGHVSTFCYDGFDRLIERRYPAPDTGVAPTCASVAAGGALPSGVTRERSVYAANGELTAVVLRDGRTISFSYDALGRLTAKGVPEADRSVAYSYDLLGRRTAATLPGANAGLSVSWTYDKAGRVLTNTGPYGRTVTYAYDPGATWSDLQWPDATRVRYQTDTLGRLTTVSDQVGVQTLATYSYDELSRRASVAYANGTQTGYAYDAQQRLSGLSHDFAGSAQDVGYGFSYNEAGEIRTRSVGNAAYETLSPGSIQRTYRPAAGSSASGGNGLNQYGRIDPAPSTFSYDGNGNLTQDADPLRVWTYAYDSEGRLTAANDTTFAYDAVGRLAEVRTGSASRRFLYDGVDRIAEYDGAGGALIGRIVHGPAVDEPLVVYEGATRTWLYGDERGSIIAHAGDSGAVANINTYGVFGEPGPANTGRFAFTGQARLADTGLYHYKARVYAPVLGRFLQPDPIGEAGGINLYAYTLNDPVNLVDPDGLQAIQLPPVDVVQNRPPIFIGGGGSGSINITGINYAALNAALRNSAAQSFAANPYVQGFAGYLSSSAQGLARIPGDLAGLYQSFTRRPLETIESVANAFPQTKVVGAGSAMFGVAAKSTLQASLLSRQFASQEIAGGHAFVKHVVQGGEFLGIRTRAEFASIIENVMENASDIRQLSGGRTAFWRNGVVVIRNPRTADGGTAFVPTNGIQYFEGLR
ncbi:MAG: RHS repeat-associated core domain-containing protein [Hyphomicrobium sp.]|jgi:RHS repeat-associated protein